MTPSTVISGVRTLLNDEQIPYRYSDAELLRRINDCLDVLVDLRPDLFIATGTHVCTAGAEQTCILDRARSINEIPRIVGGNALLQADRASLDQFRPGWYLDAQAAAVNWIPHPDLLRFYLYPPAPITQSVEVRFVQGHVPLVNLSDSIEIPDNYQPAIEAFVVNRAESKDDEHVSTGRASAFMSDFAAMVKSQ